MKKCFECDNEITGMRHLRYKPNCIIKPEFYCEKCFQKAGQPKPLSIYKLNKTH